MFNVRKFLVGACTASLAAGGLVFGGMITATPAQADQYDCYRYIETFLTNDDRDEAGFFCRLGRSFTWYHKCVDGLDKLDGVNKGRAQAACARARE